MAKYQSVIMGIFGANPNTAYTAGQLASAVGDRPENVSNDIRLLNAAGYLKQAFPRGPYELSSFEELKKFFEEAKRPTRATTRQAAVTPKASPAEKTDAALDALQDALEVEGVECGEAVQALTEALKKARDAKDAEAKAKAAKEAKKAALRAALEQAADDEALSLALSAALAALG